MQETRINGTELETINRNFNFRWSFIFAYLTLVYLSMRIISTSLNDEHSNRATIEFVLFGDSLIERTEADYKMAKNIENTIKWKHPTVDVVISSCAKGGSRILNLRNRMSECILNRKAPAGLIIYWDSDASDIEFELALTTSVLESYKSNLKFTLSTLAQYVPLIAVAGPTFDGELPRGLNKRDYIYDVYEGASHVFLIIIPIVFPV